MEKIIPESIRKAYGVTKVDKEGNKLIVYLIDPTNIFALDDIRLVTGMEVILRPIG